MPASSGVGVVSSHIEGTLRASLGQCHSSGETLDQKLVSSSKRILLHNIEFAPAESDSTYQLDLLRSKYTPLNASQAKESSTGTSVSQKSKTEVVLNGYATNKTKTMTGSGDPGDGIPRPAVVLYPPEKVQLEWKHPRHIGVGLRNNNNNCYVNSILQCLTYTAPLVNYLYSNEHTYKCKQIGFCMLCELQRHVKRCLEQPRLPNKDSAICPQSILGKIKMIAKHLTYGRQEDAHEFLRYVVEAMQKACLNGYSEKLDRLSKDTTVVNQIFGGYLRSQVLCLRCCERSNTYDPLLDISLDIKNVNNITRAFERFVQPETLENDNAYNCTRCKTKVHAQKRFTVHRPPNVLTVQIKRFDYNRLQGGKVNKHVAYPEKMDLRPYMSQRQGPPIMYQLYAVLVHVGGSCFSGHYYCYVRAPNRMWYIMNDSHVSQVSVGRVLNAEAYLLFYCRVKSSSASNNLQKPLIGPKLPLGHNSNFNNNSQKSNGSAGEPTNDVGTPISRKSSNVSDSTVRPRPVGQKIDVQPNTFSKVPASGPLPPKPTTIPLLSQRGKVSFGISKPGPKDDAGVTEANKPRIVMHIKNGKVFFPTDGEKETANKKVNGDDTKSFKSKLVPYTNDSSASDEEDPLVIRPKPPSSSSPNGKEKPSATKVECPIFDKRLNTTTIVPGAYKPLDSGTEQSSGVMQKPKDRGDVSPTKPSQLRFSSPVKRSMSDSLSVVTSPFTPHKINATTPWHVLDAEAAVSPSLASGSSNTSMNSTTEWHITPGSESRKIHHLPEAQCNGWKVTPVSEPPSGETPNVKTPEEDAKDAQQPSNAHKELNITIKKQPHNGGWESKPKNSELLKSNDEAVEVEKKSESTNTLPSVSANSTETGHSRGIEDSTSQLVNGHGGSTDTDSSSSHKKHKKKKHKRHHSDQEEGEEQGNGCGALDLLQKLKKKKKKKHKHKHKEEEEEHLLSTSDSDISRKGSKRSSSSSEECDMDRKRRKDRDESNTDSAFVWVEKTKESIEKEKTAKKEAPVRTWDQHVNDGYRRRSEEPPKPRWDGVRSSSANVVSDLKKFSSRGYGVQVSSWEGGRSHVDQDVDRDRHYERKRHRLDDYEEELDRGKTKKVKKSYSDTNYGGYNSYGGNPFQKAHEMRNMDKEWQRAPGKYDRCERPNYGYSQHPYNHHTNNYSSHYNSHRPRDSGYRGTHINKHSSPWYH